MNIERYSLSALACLAVFSPVHADDTNRYSTTVSVHGDENDNRQWLAALALSIEDRFWMRGSVGRSELASAEPNETNMAGAGIGVRGRTVSATLDFVRRESVDELEQQDWTATLNWHGARGGIGADLFARSASSESSTTQPGRFMAPPVTTTTRQSVNANGLGLHGDFSLTPHASVFAGAMRYRYDFTVDSAAASNNMPLASLLGTDGALSGVWRDQAFIEQSYRIGGSYRLRRAALSAQYMRDRIARTGETLETVQVQAEVSIAEHWLITPTIGHSSASSLGRAVFAGLSLGFNW